MRRFLIQFLLFPIRLALLLLTSFGTFIVFLGASLCGVVSFISVIGVLAMFFSGDSIGEILPFAIFAWAFSPIGVPAIAVGAIAVLAVVNKQLGELG